jgi:putative oxidoreductase
MPALPALQPGLGIAIVRIVFGIILVVSGAMKFINGIGGFAGFVGQVGFPAPEIVAPLIAILELVGGALVLLGLATRWLAILFIVEFIVTTFVIKLPRTGWDQSRIDLMMLAAALLLFLAGPGALALDAMMNRSRGESVPA